MLPLDLEVTQGGVRFADHLRLAAAILYGSTAQPKRHDPFARCRRLVVAIAIAISAVPVRGCRFVDCSFSLGESRARELVPWRGRGGGKWLRRWCEPKRSKG